MKPQPLTRAQAIAKSNDLVRELAANTLGEWYPDPHDSGVTGAGWTARAVDRSRRASVWHNPVIDSRYRADVYTAGHSAVGHGDLSCVVAYADAVRRSQVALQAMIDSLAELPRIQVSP